MAHGSISSRAFSPSSLAQCCATSVSNPNRNSRIASWPPWTKSIGTPSSILGPTSSTKPPDMIRTSKSMYTEGERAREQTIKVFHDLYRKNAADFPPEAKDGRYLELLRVSYPIHPELFKRLAKDWASLPTFQRTRGVLKFMANAVGVLWQQQAKDPLITAARVPLANERVRASVLYPLDSA